MQNPYDRWLDDFIPEGSPSIAQVGEEGSATDRWLQQLPEPTRAPLPPGTPVPALQPTRSTMTQSVTPDEYVYGGLKGLWGTARRTAPAIPNNLLTTIKPSTLKEIFWEIIQPVAIYDRPQGTSWFDRPNWLQSIIDDEKQRDPSLTDEQIIENLKNLPEWQFAHKLPKGNFIVAPMLRDMVHYIHGGTQAARNIFGKYTDRFLPDWLNPTLKDEDLTALGKELTRKWDFLSPEAQREFEKQASEGTALLEYGGDMAAAASIVGRLAGATGTSATAASRMGMPKTNLNAINQINRKLGLPDTATPRVTKGMIDHHLAKSKFARGMDRAGGHLQAVDQFLNEGGLAPGWYSMPTKQIGRLAGRIPGGGRLQRAIQGRVDPRTGRFEMKSGIADILDPELWAIRLAGRGLKEVGTRALSPFADMVNKRMTRLFQKHGIDPKTLPATLTSRSETVATKEGIALNLDEEAITRKLQNSLRLFQAKAENIAETLQADGDLTKMGKELEQAHQQFEREFSRWARHYRNQIVPGSENVIADLTPIFQLRQQMEIERQRLHPSGAVSDEPSMVRYLDDLIDTMQRTEQAGLTPEAVEAIRAGQPPPTPPIAPEGATPLPQTIGAVRTENLLGLPYRVASSGDYKHHYNVEYQLIPAEKVVTSHLLTGEENPLFAQLTEQLGYTNLQPREFKGDFVRSVAADLQPMGYLADMRILDRGAPIVAEVPDVTYTRPDGTEVTETLYLMLAGNNRMLALEMARQEYPEQYARYRQELEQEIGHYGFVVDDITTADTALFRVLTEKDANFAQLVDQSNTTAIRLFDAGEQSEKDREHLNQDLLQRLDFNFNGRLGDILQNETNIDVIFDWLKRFNAADRGNMTTTEIAQRGENRGSRITTLTEQGVQRLVNALFRRTFDGAYGRKMMELFVTRQDSDIKNIESAVINALQDMADLQIGTLGANPKYDPDYQIAEDLAQAVVGAWQMIQEGQQQGLSKTESVEAGRQQGELLTSMARIANDEQQLLLDAIVEAISTPAVLTNFLQDYVAAVREQGSPGDLLSGENPPKRLLIEQLHYEYFTPDGETPPQADGLSETQEQYTPPNRPTTLAGGMTREEYLNARQTGRVSQREHTLKEGEMRRAYHATLEYNYPDIIDSEVIESPREDWADGSAWGAEVDAMAGDNFRVFLSVGTQHYYDTQDGWGFIFDPIQLLQEGARVGVDLVSEYHAILDKAITDHMGIDTFTREALAVKNQIFEAELGLRELPDDLKNVRDLASQRMQELQRERRTTGEQGLKNLLVDLEQTIDNPIQFDAYMDYLQENNITEDNTPVERLEALFDFLKTQNTNVMGEIVIDGDLPLDKAIGVIENGIVKMLTPESIGKSPDQWRFQGEDAPHTVAEPVSPLELWHRARRQLEGEGLDRQRQLQRQQQADDVLNEVEQLTFDFETVEAPEPQTRGLQGLVRRARRTAQKIKRLVAPFAESKRLVSPEIEVLLPGENHDAAVAELNAIEAVSTTTDDTIKAVPDRINEAAELEMMRQEPATPEELEYGLSISRFEGDNRFTATDTEVAEAIRAGEFDALPEAEKRHLNIVIARNRIRRQNETTTKRGLEVQISKQNIQDVQTKLEQVFAILEKHGAEVNETTGFHVHVDKRGMSAGEMANIAFAWLKYEWAIVQQPGWQNDYSRALTQEAMGRTERVFGREAPPEPMLDPNATEQDVIAMETAYLKTLQNRMRKGHSVMLDTGYRVVGDESFGWTERDRINLRGADDQTIEFRQGQGTLDLEQAMKNVAFALGFVEKFKNQALRPGVRPPMSEAMRRIMPDREETDAEYYERIYPENEEIWDTNVGRNVPLIEKLQEWDADPNLVYVPKIAQVTDPAWTYANATFKGFMHRMPNQTSRIEVMVGKRKRGGGFTEDTDDTTIRASLPIPHEFYTDQLTTFGEVFDPPNIEHRVRKLFVNILDRVSIPLVGMQIESPRELAVVSQALRANHESTRGFYYDSKKGEIKGYQVISLNRTSASAVIPSSVVKKIMQDLNADTFFMMHNHPGGKAEFSHEDIINAGNHYREHLGDAYIGQIVINSGEFAYEWQQDPRNTAEDVKRWHDNDYKFIVHAEETLEGRDWDELDSFGSVYKKQTWGRMNYAEQQLHSRSRERQLWQSHLSMREQERLRISVVDMSDPKNIKVIEDDASTRSQHKIKNSVELTQEELGWNPESTETPPNMPDFGMHPIRRRDPRFRGAGTTEARSYGEGLKDLQEVVELGKKLQTPKDWITIAFINSKLRMTKLAEVHHTALEKTSKVKIDRWLRAEATIHGANHVFIMIGEGDWYNNTDEAMKFFFDRRDPNKTISPDLIQAISVDKNPNPFFIWNRPEPEFAMQKFPIITEQNVPPQPQPTGDTSRARQTTLPIREQGENYTLKGRAQSRRSEEGRTTPGRRAQEEDLAAVQPPVTYGQLEAWRTYMRRAKEQHEVGSPQYVAAGRMEASLTEAMERSMMGFSPEMWRKLEQFYRLYKDGAVSAQSKIAKAIRQNAEVKGVEGTSNYARMAQTLFSPGDTPENIGLLYRLIGGFDSEAGRQIRAVFLESLLENSRPKGATLEQEVITARTTDARRNLENAQAQVAQARTPAEVETAQQRLEQAQEALDTATEESRTMHPIDTINPAGLSGELERWLKKTGRGYKRKTLDAILGKDVVDALIDLRDFEQSFAGLKRNARGSRTAPWFSRWLDNDARRGRLKEVVTTLALAISPHGRSMGMIGGGIGALGLAFTGSPIVGAGIGIAAFIVSWLGAAGLDAFMKYMQGKPAGERYLLEGTVVALDHVLTRTPVLASPEQAQAHERRISASDYAGPRALWQLARPARFIPKGDDDED